MAELLPARARRVLDVLASLVLLLFTVLLAAMLLGRVESAYASNESTFDLRLPVWPWLAAIWLGVASVFTIVSRLAHAARLRAEREVHGRGGAGMSTADLVAVAGFAAMFLMMLVRVPIGVAMALTGVGGFAAIAGWGPALNLLATSPVRTATDYNFSLIPMFILMGVSRPHRGCRRNCFAPATPGSATSAAASRSPPSARGGFAAICGSSVATAATMSNIALPEMRRLATATISQPA